MQKTLSCAIVGAGSIGGIIDSPNSANITLQAILTQNQSAEFVILLGDKDYGGKGLSKELLLDYDFHF